MLFEPAVAVIVVASLATLVQVVRIGNSGANHLDGKGGNDTLQDTNLSGFRRRQ